MKADTVFYDLGANVGYYAFIANLYISTGKIYSFEPMPANIEVFKSHLKLNEKRMINKSIELLPYAISDSEKEVAFSNNDKAIEGNTYINSKVENVSSKSLLVKCFSVDGLLRVGYQKPDVIKIDVEGAEYDVLRGARETLSKYKPNILLATHDCHLPGVQKLCVDLLKDLGYGLTLLNSSNKTMAGLDDYIAIHRDNIK
jgi:FkbM family methyltransferase